MASDVKKLSEETIEVTSKATYTKDELIEKKVCLENMIAERVRQNNEDQEELDNVNNKLGVLNGGNKK